jgi:hypothetical protein
VLLLVVALVLHVNRPNPNACRHIVKNLALKRKNTVPVNSRRHLTSSNWVIEPKQKVHIMKNSGKTVLVALFAICMSTLAQASQNGGTVTINATSIPDAVWSQLSTISANGAGSGNGGTIDIENGNSADLSGLPPGVIAATGGTTNGVGGNITVKNIGTWPPDYLIDDVIKVKANTSSLIASSDGNSKINGSVEENVNLASPPSGSNGTTSFVTSNQPTLFNGIYAGLSGPMKTAVQTANIYFYNFASQSDAQKYLGPSRVLGNDTVLGFSNYTPRNYIVVYTSSTLALMKATARHELGHQIDHLGGVSNRTAFANAVQADWNAFNNQTTNPRCTLFPGHCANTMTNQQILASTIPSYFGSAPWTEIFAEEFAIAAGGGYDSTIDGWLVYFKNSQNYVNSGYAAGF